jgi:ACT domain-containing protein
MLIKQISVFLENRKGRLSEITEILAKNDINIRALSIADTSNFGILRLIVNNTHKAEKALKENGFTVSVNSMVSISLSDEPGGLANVLKVLSNDDIQIDYMYAFISHDPDKAYVLMRIEEDFKAQKLLKDAGYEGLETVQ